MAVLTDFSYNPDYDFVAERIAKLPKKDRFSQMPLVTITRLLFCLWTDPLWSYVTVWKSSIVGVDT